MNNFNKYEASLKEMIKDAEENNFHNSSQNPEIGLEELD